MTRFPAPRFRVLVADDHAVVAEGIALALATHFAVVGTIRHLAELLPAILSLRPEVVVLDLAFPEGSSLPSLREAIAHPAVRSRFVILTAHDSPALAKAALDAGAVAFITKAVGAQELRLAVTAAAQRSGGNSRQHLPTPHRARPARERHPISGALLSRRQIEILVLMLEGLPRKQIAANLGLTVKGVDYNVTAIKLATGIPTLLGLCSWIHEHRDPLTQTLADVASAGSP